MNVQIEVKIKTAGMLKSGSIPPISAEMAKASRLAVIEYYTQLGGHYAVWGQDISAQVQDNNTVSLSINNPILRHKITGGTIHAKNKKYLTIPLNETAKLTSAPNYPKKLVFITSKAGNHLLVEISGGNQIEPAYLLRESVYQPPIEKATPKIDPVEIAAVKAVDQKIEQNEKRGS